MLTIIYGQVAAKGVVKTGKKVFRRRSGLPCGAKIWGGAECDEEQLLRLMEVSLDFIAPRNGKFDRVFGWPRGKGGVPGGKWASQKTAAENTRFLLSRLESDNARVMGAGRPFQRHAIESTATGLLNFHAEPMLIPDCALL